MKFFANIFKNSESTETELESPFKITICREDFCNMKTKVLFKKILHRCYSRSEGASGEEKIASLFDSNERSGAGRGLISLLAHAMTYKEEIAIIYQDGIVRRVTNDEKREIEADYKKTAKSSKGVLVDFRKYELTDLVMAYMSIVYDILNSMNTQVGLAQALQIKVNALRGTVSIAGKDEPVQQAKDINEALLKGRSVLMDKNDVVETLTLNSDSTKNAISLINALMATDLGVSLSFVNGELTTGMSATGEADENANEYGFQDYFNSIFKPTCDPLYGWKLTFVTDDWRWFNALADKLIIIENSSILSDEQKSLFVNRLIPVGKKVEVKTQKITPPTNDQAQPQSN